MDIENKTFIITVLFSFLNNAFSQSAWKARNNVKREDEDKSDEYSESTPNSQLVPAKEPHYIMIAAVVAPWALFIIGMAISFFVLPTKSKKSVELWEFLAFSFHYFSLGGFIAIFLPNDIEKAEGITWMGNGGLGGGISLVGTTALCAIYARGIKVMYGGDPSGVWCAGRLVYLGVIMAAGFATGGYTINRALKAPEKVGEMWLFAFGVISSIYLLVALPVVLIAVWMLGLNEHPVDEKKEDVNSLRVKSIAQKSKAGGGHIKAISAQGVKAGSKSPLSRTASQQSTGSSYFQALVKHNVEVKSISQYGTMGGGGSSPSKPPPPAASSPPTQVRKTSSQQSTGSGYYAQLMQKGDAPQVKSISQYGALLQGGPK